MKKELKGLGRTLGETSFSKKLSETESHRSFVLKSGAEAHFTLTRVLHADIEKQTYVDAGVNGRDQSFITEESVSDIARTITLQQFFPAIGREVDGRIEVLDGSRRRAACIFNGAAFDVLVTRDDLSLTDARQLAIDIQTAKEHTLRELGKRLKLMYPEGTTQSEIAKAEGISPAKITRAFQAASVPDDMIAVFPSAGELSISDYQALLDVAEKASAKNISIGDLVTEVREKIEAGAGSDVDETAFKTRVIGFFRSEISGLKTNKTASKIVTVKIADFADKKQFARKKTDAEKRLVTYEFSRLPTTYQAELDAAVNAVIQKMKMEEGGE
ncbi:ParB/RepB/Spo0J family partition protein [Pantoea sp. PNT02]|uniref:ParB/RepB/Spo0J family partition protein n=1 Tax=Pantoea sp. PNT02 TaxID=2769261 RepID=UPI0017803BBC|nr:ParB family protein [Pantoea sp. PNT02]MBD9646348.1 ParB/RepB/Spo0J family partition protein [Pantoea sp. PNT02]